MAIKIFLPGVHARPITAGISLFLTLTVLQNTMCSSASADSKIKQPNVSGQFYHSNSKELSAEIDRYFKAADITALEKPVDVVIVPHAGYIYSGWVAAYGFKSLSAKKYKTIVILAPSHYVGFDGISIWEEGGFQTPLGVVSVDDDFTKRLMRANEKFYFAPQAFDSEHSLEVEIPFLQKTFSGFKIVPVIMGQPRFELLEDFAKTLRDIIGDREDVLVVVSTDLSHYHEDAFARDIDHRTIDAVKRLEAKQVWQECQARTIEMCGCVPVTAAILYARQKGLTDVDILRYANSGDVTGDKEKVVGYASMVIYRKDSGSHDHPKSQQGARQESALTGDQKKELVAIARAAIEEYIKTGKRAEFKNTDSRLLATEGVFVTIHKAGQLRGCIGNIVTQKPLFRTVRDMAIASATEDPRFPSVQPDELGDIDVEISVLSKPRVIKAVDEIELGTHGVIVSQDPSHYGVFLPQVATETKWSKEEFLSQLCSQKAKLPADAWKDPKTKIEVFTAQVFSEKDIHQ